MLLLHKSVFNSAHLLNNRVLHHPQVTISDLVCMNVIWLHFSSLNDMHAMNKCSIYVNNDGDVMMRSSCDFKCIFFFKSWFGNIFLYQWGLIDFIVFLKSADLIFYSLTFECFTYTSKFSLLSFQDQSQCQWFHKVDHLLFQCRFKCHQDM